MAWIENETDEFTEAERGASERSRMDRDWHPWDSPQRRWGGGIVVALRGMLATRASQNRAQETGGGAARDQAPAEGEIPFGRQPSPGQLPRTGRTGLCVKSFARVEILQGGPRKTNGPCVHGPEWD